MGTRILGTIAPGSTDGGSAVPIAVNASGALTVTTGGSTVAQVGAVNETAPSTDTASSGLNGRLQRIAQRLTTLMAAPQPVGVQTVKIAPTATVDTSAYAPHDALTALLTLTGAARVVGGSGRIVKCNLFDGSASAGTTFEIFFFDLPGGGGAGQITAVAANTAFAISDADMAHCLGSILVTNSSLISTTGILYQNFSTVFPFKCAAADANLYAQVVLRAGTPTYGAADIVASFLIEQD